MNPGEKVVVLEPAHENYHAGIAFAGGIPVCVPLRPPHYHFDADELARAFQQNPKAVLFNSPHNPSGRVFTGQELFLWDMVTRTFRTGPIGASYPEEAIAFHPRAPVFTALNANGELTLFHLETGEPIRSFDFALGKKVRCACFSPDGLTCAVGGSNKQFAVFDVDV